MKTGYVFKPSPTHLCVYGSHTSVAQELSLLRCNQTTDHIHTPPPSTNKSSLIFRVGLRGERAEGPSRAPQVWGRIVEDKGEKNEGWRILPVINYGLQQATHFPDTSGFLLEHSCMLLHQFKRP